MALLLFSCLRPLTCRTVAVLRVVSVSLPVRRLCTSVNSRLTLTPVAIARPVGCSLTSCKTLFYHKSVISVRQSCRCLTSQCNDDNHHNVSGFSSISKSGLQKTEGKCVASESTITTTTEHSERADVEQDISTQNAHSEEGRVEFLSISEEQSHSPYGFSSNIPHNHQQEETWSTNSSDSAAESGVRYSSDEGTAQPAATVVDWPGVSDDSTPLHTDSTPVLTDSTPVHSDNTPVQSDSTPVPAEDEVLQDLPPPRPMEPTFTLAPYMAQSQALQNLVALGVDMSAVEKVKKAADHLVQADWTVDIQPRLLFLRDIGVQDAQLGRVLSKNPLLLKEDVEEMQGRISYLESKKFSQEQIERIVTSAPLTLLLPVHYVDKKLGFLQTSFHLTGNEVRLVAAKLPKIIPWKLQKLKDIRFYMKDMLGFSDRELKAMLLATPRVYLSDRHQLGKRFDLLHNVMGLSHQHLAAWPAVFRTRLHVVEQRHRFLVLLGRAQYDPTKENYVSLRALVSGRDRDFCFHVAKASASQFYSFLKSL